MSFLDTDRWRWLGVEFLVIVLGVLSALFVDTWLEERQDAERAAAYRERLATDLETDIAVLQSQQAYMDSVRDFGLILLADLQGERSLEDFQLLFSAFNAAEELGFTSQSSTFEDLRNTGMLRLFDDVQLRVSIADYYRSIENRTQFWTLDREYRRLVRGIVPNPLQEAIHIRCQSEQDTSRTQLPSGLAIIGANLLPAYHDVAEHCGIPSDLIDASGPAARIRSSQQIEDALRYRISQIRIAIRLFGVQQQLAEDLLVRLHGEG